MPARSRQFHFRRRLFSSAVALAVGLLSAVTVVAQSNVLLELAGRWTNSFSRYARAIRVTNGIAYLGYDSLEIIDVRNPTRPVWLASYVPAEGGTIGQIEIVGGKAFLALDIGVDGTSQGGFDVVDVSQPSRPQRLGHSSDPTAAGGVQIVGSYALVACTYSGLNILDISHPDAPALLGQYAAGNPNALQVSGNRVYLAGFCELRVFDISSLPSASALGSYADWSAGDFSSVKVVGSYAYLSKFRGVQVVDLTSLTLSGQFSIDGYVSNLAQQGQDLYLAAGNLGVLMCDIAGPTQPRLVGGGLPIGSAGGLDLADNHAFVLTDQELEVYRISGKPIGITEQPRSQVFINNGQPLVLSGHGISVSPFVYQWSKDGTALTNGGRFAGTTGPVLTIAEMTPEDSGLFRLTVSNEFRSVTSMGATVSYQPGLYEALDYPELEWVGGWVWQTNVTHDGVDAAQGGPIRSGIVAAATGISTEVTGPGTLSFWWRVTATHDDWPVADFGLSLYIGEQERAATSEEAFRNTGPETWEHVVVAVPPGLQNLTWLLQTLGGCTDPAEGTVWLDEVMFTPTAACITRVERRPSDNSWYLDCQAPPGGRVFLQRSTNLQTWEDFLGPIAAPPVNGRLSFDPPNSGMDSAFYRLRVVGQ